MSFRRVFVGRQWCSVVNVSAATTLLLLLFDGQRQDWDLLKQTQNPKPTRHNACQSDVYTCQKFDISTQIMPYGIILGQDLQLVHLHQVSTIV